MPIEKTRRSGWTASSSIGTTRKVHVLTHTLHYGTGDLRRDPRLQDEERDVGLPSHRPHAPAAPLREDHHDGAPVLGRAARRGDEGDDPRRTTSRSSRCCTSVRSRTSAYGEFGLNPLSNPVQVVDRRVPVGDVPRRRGRHVRYPREDVVVAAHRHERAPAAGEDDRPATSTRSSRRSRCSRPATTKRCSSTRRGRSPKGPGENFFIVRDGVIVTADRVTAGLDGITRDSVMTIARDLGYEVREEGHRPRGRLPRRRSLLHGHGGRAHADPRDRRPRDRDRRAGPDHEEAAGDVLRRGARRDRDLPGVE